MLDELFENNIGLWILGILVFATLIVFAVKYRFFYGILKICMALLIYLLVFASIPIIQNMLYGEWFLAEFFPQFTPRIWDDLQWEFDTLIFPIIIWVVGIAVFILALKGKKRAERSEIKSRDD